MTKRLVVVGGGAAGMSAASAARRVDASLEIVVLEASGHAAWGLCGIPYYLAGVVPESADLVAHPPDVFRQDRRIDLQLHARALELDPVRRRVTVERDAGSVARLDYSAVVVTAGAEPLRPPLPGLEDDRVFTVRTMEGARDLRSRLDAGRIARALVVGGGYIGLEMAEALASRGCTVHVVEALDQVMPTLDGEVAGVVDHEVRRHVDLRLGTRLEGLEPRHAHLVAGLSDGSALEVDAVVLATGIRPAGGIAAAAGAETSAEGALLVDERMRTSLAGVLAAGDCIAPYHRVLGRAAYTPLAPAANKTGRVAGTVAAGGEASFPGTVGTAVVKVFDLTVARTGLTLGEAREAGLDAIATDATARSRAKYYPGGEDVVVRLVHRADGRLLGGQIASRDPAAGMRIDVLATALHAGLDVDDVADLDLAYAPPYSPVWDPLLRVAQKAQRATHLSSRVVA